MPTAGRGDGIGGRASPPEPRRPALDAAAAQTPEDLAGLLRTLRRWHARSHRGGALTYRELAARTGWSASAIAEYLTGKTLPPTDKFDALVGLFGATPAEQRALADARDRIEEQLRRAPPGPRRRDRDPPRPVPRQLPADGYWFVGRQLELARLDALLTTPPADAGTAVVISAVSGAAGAGKTALAVHWAHRVADQFPDGQLYVNLRGFDPGRRATAPVAALHGFLVALGTPAERIPPGLDARAALYRSLLSGRRVLVLLDNARDADQVRPLLPGTPTARAVVTSRNTLASLVVTDGAHPLTLDVLSPADARDLLGRRLGEDRVAAEPDAAARIIAAAARLPLALSIAAARAQQTGFPLAAVAAELTEAGRRLSAFDAGDPTSQVRSVFSLSYAALPARAARLFRLIGLHPRPELSLAAAASLAGEAPTRARAALTELASASLIAEPAPGRYTLHDLLHAYAAELADDEPEPDRHAALRRMFDHYRHSAHAADRLLYPSRDPIIVPERAAAVAVEEFADEHQALRWFTAEYPALLASVDQAAASGCDDHAWQLAWGLATFLQRRGHWPDLVTVGHTALRAARRAADPAGEFHALRGLGVALTRLGRYDEARTHLLRGVEVSAQLNDPACRAVSHRVLSELLTVQDRHQEAIAHAERALALYRSAGHAAGQALALNAIGWGHTRAGDHRRGIVHCEQALALHQRLGNRLGEAATWHSLGYARHHLGEHREAVGCYRQALSLMRAISDWDGEVQVLSDLGEALHAAGDSAAARRVWRRAVDVLGGIDPAVANQLVRRIAAAQQSERRAQAADPTADAGVRG